MLELEIAVDKRRVDCLYCAKAGFVLDGFHCIKQLDAILSPPLVGIVVGTRVEDMEGNATCPSNARIVVFVWNWLVVFCCSGSQDSLVNLRVNLNGINRRTLHLVQWVAIDVFYQINSKHLPN